MKYQRACARNNYSRDAELSADLLCLSATASDIFLRCIYHMCLPELSSSHQELIQSRPSMKEKIEEIRRWTNLISWLESKGFNPELLPLEVRSRDGALLKYQG